MSIKPIIDRDGLHGVITVSSKRQITIPKFAQTALGLQPGDRVLFEGHMVMQPGDKLRLTVRRGRIEVRPAAREVSGG